MANGFMQRFKGKIMAASLWMAPGNTLFDSATGIACSMDYIQRIALPVTAVANTDFSTSIPPGRIIQRAAVYTTLAYTGTTVTIQLGSTLGGVDYVSAVSIKALGLVNLTLLNTAMANLGSMPSGSPNLFIRVVQTGQTAVGLGTLVLEFA